jgi:hypothetical protein
MLFDREHLLCFLLTVGRERAVHENSSKVLLRNADKRD